jgi:hypothetical protein
MVKEEGSSKEGLLHAAILFFSLSSFYCPHRAHSSSTPRSPVTLMTFFPPCRSCSFSFFLPPPTGVNFFSLSPTDEWALNVRRDQALPWNQHLRPEWKFCVFVYFFVFSQWRNAYYSQQVYTQKDQRTLMWSCHEVSSSVHPLKVRSRSVNGYSRIGRVL